MDGLSGIFKSLNAPTIINDPAVTSSLTVIVPAFNDAAGLEMVLKRLVDMCSDHGWELLVVDDGSTDETPAVLAAYEGRIRVVRHRSNRGYGASLKTGVLAAKTENVLFIDADGQHNVDQIPELADALKDQECVFTARTSNAGIPLIRRPGKWILHKVCNFLAARKIPDINCGFRAGRRHIYMMMLELLPDGFSFSTTSLMYVMRSRFSHVFIPTTCRSRVGSSTVRIVYDGLKTMLLALRLMMLFDPIRAFGYPAFLFIASGFLYQIYIIFTFHLTIVGGSILLVLIGVLLFFLGLLGDQIASLRKEMSSFNCLLWESLEAKDRESNHG
jgi:glycosyltransferase involved in cell wall biosynthesis